MQENIESEMSIPLLDRCLAKDGSSRLWRSGGFDLFVGIAFLGLTRRGSHKGERDNCYTSF